MWGGRVQLSLQHHAAHAALCNNDRERSSLSLSQEGQIETRGTLTWSMADWHNAITAMLFIPCLKKALLCIQPISLACLWHVYQTSEPPNSAAAHLRRLRAGEFSLSCAVPTWRCKGTALMSEGICFHFSYDPRLCRTKKREERKQIKRNKLKDEVHE